MAGFRYLLPAPDVTLKFKKPQNYERIRGPDIVTININPEPSSSTSYNLNRRQSLIARGKKAGVDFKSLAMEMIEKRRRSTRENSCTKANPGYDLYGMYFFY